MTGSQPYQAPRGPRLLIVIAALTLAALATSGLSAARPPAGPLLRLHRGMIDARAPTALQVSGLAAVAPEAAVIQFAGPISAADRAALDATGVTRVEYLPDYAYVVQGGEAQIAAAAALPGVYARAPLLAADKLAPALLGGLLGSSLIQPVAVTIRPWPGEAQALAAALASMGTRPGQPVTAAQLSLLAATPAVRWIEPRFAPRLLNDEAREIMEVEVAWERHGLYGEGQIVGVADSGLDTGDPATISPDFAGRLVATHVMSAGGTLADEFGHGTHVAGSLAGAGVRSGADPAQRRYEGSLAGVAPAASLVIQAFELSDNGVVSGLGDDPYAMLEQAYASGARIHNNSWGGPTGTPFLDPEGYFGGYTTPSQRTDEFIWRHPDMAVFFAAGNSGNDGDYYLLGCLPNGDGWIDEDSLMAPGTAKNVITVGASESVRLDGNLSTLTWRDFDATCYGKEPLASDLLSDNPNGMAPFSSRGPVDDGRVKPDLVAPGTSIVSNRSSHPEASDLWGKYTPNSAYTIGGGTSMATPLAAGAGALVREWLGRQGLANPSAAAVKGVLLSTAADIAPGQYVVGDRQEIPSTRPNAVVGWGRLDLGFLGLAPPYRHWVDDHRVGLATGESVTYQHSNARPLVVTDSAQPLRVTLVWTDPPASLSAARQLVNDLDLVVVGPDGRQYWGNGAEGGDRINNVEGVIIEAPLPGAYTVEVRAHNTPIESQPYALVVAGPLAASPLALEASVGLVAAESAQAPLTRAMLRVTGAQPEQIRYTLTLPPAHGELLLDERAIVTGRSFSQADVDSGRVSYAHDGGETERDSFSFTVADEAGHTLAPATFPITITPVNDAPTAADDVAQTVAGQPVMVEVLANDADAEGDSLAVVSVGVPSAGTAATDGTGVTYTPPEAFTGAATFSYSVRDDGGAAAEGLVRVLVAPRAAAPAAQRIFLPILRR